MDELIPICFAPLCHLGFDSRFYPVKTGEGAGADLGFYWVGAGGWEAAYFQTPEGGTVISESGTVTTSTEGSFMTSDGGTMTLVGTVTLGGGSMTLEGNNLIS